MALVYLAENPNLEILDPIWAFISPSWAVYSRWISSLPVDLAMSKGTWLRKFMEDNPVFHLDFLIVRAADIAAFGEDLVGKCHGVYFLSSTLKRSATLALLQSYFRDPLYYNLPELLGPNDRIVWDYMVAVGLLAFQVNQDPVAAARYGLVCLEACYEAWYEDHGRWLIPSQIPQGAQPVPESWD